MNNPETAATKPGTSSTLRNSEPVVDPDDNDCMEMGNSLTNEKTNGIDETPSSPVMFPSQETVKSSEVTNSEAKEEKICLEIIDEDHEEANDEPERDDTGGKSRMVSKRALRLSLERSAKRKCMQANEEKETSSSEITMATISTAIVLRRTFKRKRCTTIEEADKFDVYFAPPGVKAPKYAKVIIRKFQDYGKRLRISQTRSSLVHPPVNPIEPRPVVTSRVNLRRSVLKKLTREAQSPPQEQIEDKDLDVVKPSPDIRENKIEIQTVMDTNSCPATTSANVATVTALSPGNTPAEEPMDDDVVITSAQRTPDHSPLKTLSQRTRRAILRESSSDEDVPKFSFEHSEVAPTASEDREQDVTSTTVGKKPGRNLVSEQVECPMCFRMFTQNQIQKHAASCDGQSGTRSTSDLKAEKTPTSTTKCGVKPSTRHVISIDIDHKSSTSIKDFNILRSEDQGISEETRPMSSCVELGQLSPVIKVRTPTKVREMRMLELTVPVCDLKTKSKASERKLSGNKPTIHEKLMKLAKNVKQETSDDIKTTKSDVGERKAPETYPNRTGRNRRSLANEAILKKDFIPIEANENNDIEDKPLPKRRSLRKTLSMTESDEEDCKELKMEDIISEVTSESDDSALAFLSSAYNGKKRKSKNPTVPLKVKRPKHNGSEDFERCTLCDELIPVNLFVAHVTEEIKKNKRTEKN